MLPGRPRDRYDDWSDDDPHLTWGCIVMHNPDIAAWFDDVTVGTMVVIF